MRIKSDTSLHSQEKPELCPGNVHAYWRCIECCGPNSGDGYDILECSRCGQQKTVLCCFDDDYC